MESKKGMDEPLFLQGRNKDVDIENGLEDTGWEGEAGRSESSIDIYTLPNVNS